MEEKKEVPFADILRAIADVENPVPIHLLFRLSDLGVDEWAQFSTTWQKMDGERQRVVIRHLADLSEDSFIIDFSPIFTLGLDAASEAVRLACLDGLWDASDPKLISRLMQVVETDTAVSVRAAAINTLAHYIVMAEWGEIAQRFTQPVVTKLIALYDDEETPIPMACAAIEALGASANERTPEIIRQAYESDSRAMQLSAIFAMGNSADPRWLHLIIDEMENIDPRFREAAAQAAGLVGRSDALSGLAGLLEDDDFDVQLAAIHALGQLGGDVAQELLSELLEDDEREVLHEAAEEALDEMNWLANDFELLDFDGADHDDEIYLN